MAIVATVGSTVQGTTTGEHSGHYDQYGSPIHGACTLTGQITSGSSKLRINGVNVAIVDSPTTESDCCDSGRTGKLGSTVHKLRVNNKSVQCVGDSIIPHNGTATIKTGNDKIRTI